MRHKLRIAVVVGSIAGASVLLACWGGYYPSVHFNSEQPDFGAPPSPLTISSWEEIGDRPTPEVMQDRSLNGPTEEEGERRQSERIAQAKKAEASKSWGAAQKLWMDVFEMNLSAAASARDHLEVDRQAEAGFAAPAIRYIALRNAYDAGKVAQALSGAQKLASEGSAGPVRAHALYLIGAIQADQGKYDAAAKTFAQCASRFPKNARAESALIMIPRCLLRSPTQKDPMTWVDSPLPPATSVATSRSALQKLLSAFPTTRFRASALGWLGRCDYVMGRYDAALADYLKQLNASKSIQAQTLSLSSIRTTSSKLTAEQASRFGADLRKNPDLLPAYLDYRLFHTSAKASDLQALTNLAREVIQAKPNAKLSSAILARLAEISYLGGNFAEAITWSNRALGERGPAGIDLARYVRGGASSKLGDKDKALSDFEQLVLEFPKSYLVDSAKENLALLYEGKGEFGKALDLYFDLNYQADAAYLLDARMSLADLQKFLDGHRQSPKVDLIRFTIGMHLLRADNFDLAKEAFEGIESKQLRQLAGYGDPEQFAYLGGMDQLQNPFKTIMELEALHKAVSEGRTDNEKAAALYAVASYFYEHRNLLLYNAAAWQGSRQLLGYSWNEKVATSSDDEAVTNSTLIQECLNRCKELCLELAATFPKSPTAPRAIYRAACCARRLASFNSWWRNYNKKRNQWNESISLMKRLAADYPTDPLAKNAVKFAKVFEDEAKEADGGVAENVLGF